MLERGDYLEDVGASFGGGGGGGDDGALTWGTRSGAGVASALQTMQPGRTRHSPSLHHSAANPGPLLLQRTTAGGGDELELVPADPAHGTAGSWVWLVSQLKTPPKPAALPPPAPDATPAALTGGHVLLHTTVGAATPSGAAPRRDGAPTPAVPPQLQPSPGSATAAKRPAEQTGEGGAAAPAGAAANSPGSAKRQKLEGDEQMAEAGEAAAATTAEQQQQPQAMAAAPPHEEQEQQPAALAEQQQLQQQEQALPAQLAETQAVLGLPLDDGGEGEAATEQTAEQERGESPPRATATFVLPPTQVFCEGVVEGCWRCAAAA